MKTKLSSFVLAAIAGVITLLAYPAYAFNQGQCVAVKAVVAPNGYMRIKQNTPIYTDETGSKVHHMFKPGDDLPPAFIVTMRKGKMVALTGGNNLYDTPYAGLIDKHIGWMHRADLEPQSPRNCNF